MYRDAILLIPNAVAGARALGIASIFRPEFECEDKCNG